MANTMTTQLLTLADHDLRGLATALRSGRLVAPFTGIAVQRVATPRLADALAHDLQTLVTQGFTAAQIAALIDILLHDRAQRRRREASIDVVTTGPEAGATTNRDTSVVVRELFAQAERSVLVAGYAVYQGQRVFQALADRMQQRPELAVRLFLDVRRPAGDTSIAAEVVRRFGERFCRYEWPQGRPLPQVFYFPRSLEAVAEKKAALHAKCVVVDRRSVFVSSANFTEAAHDRNIEVGLLIQAGWLAERITEHFDTLVADRLLLPVYREPDRNFRRRPRESGP
jgi:phosphatidylserine/phosphatidylglycerophosphate/cardiolipin synthase-like enzyme